MNWTHFYINCRNHQWNFTFLFDEYAMASVCMQKQDLKANKRSILPKTMNRNIMIAPNVFKAIYLNQCKFIWGLLHIMNCGKISSFSLNLIHIQAANITVNMHTAHSIEKDIHRNRT